MNKFLRQWIIKILASLSIYLISGCCWGINYEVKIPEDLK
ncbi:cyclic lactone autoinducer peptide [Enterococcus avium]|jgi:cyclic lactone autoinducer peptide|nr:cyclic lactone autoinducer peptide [Enterococcus avium]MDT2427915.1 cyclic lactone autoinducer peptide [Enterococcus avium]MDT2458685.1 cyclic lactone autoinducer peptide [Enterococcus avium]